MSDIKIALIERKGIPEPFDIIEFVWYLPERINSDKLDNVVGFMRLINGSKCYLLTQGDKRCAVIVSIQLDKLRMICGKEYSCNTREITNDESKFLTEQLPMLYDNARIAN